MYKESVVPPSYLNFPGQNSEFLPDNYKSEKYS